MAITSLGYILFFIIVTLIYYKFHQTGQWIFLLIASLMFTCSYSLFATVAVVLSCLIAYSTALVIENSHHKKIYVIIGVCLNIALLIVLKYKVIFDVSTIAFISEKNEPYYGFVNKYIVPIGVSYYTLQLISYTLDVYWEKIAVEKNFFKLLTFTIYFPQLIQGPISKYKELSDELFRYHRFQWKNLKYGYELILWGFFKKMVIGDITGIYVNQIFNSDNQPYGFTVMGGVILYSLQLYGNFSGGIDIIRGVSECLDIKLKDNFRQPYFSQSLSEFWRRWHMSLGEWMKDYLFVPISISSIANYIKAKLKKRINKKTANLFIIAISNVIVFFFVGLWHGIESKYTVWGLYNGLIIGAADLLSPKIKEWKSKSKFDFDSKMYKYFCIGRTFLIVSIGRLFDCSNSALHAGKLLLNLFSFNRSTIIRISVLHLVSIIMGCMILLVVSYKRENGIDIRGEIDSLPWGVQTLILTALLQFVALFGRVPGAGGFLYANF